jgi:hypothetical protein
VILLGEKLEIEFVSLVSDAIISLINPNTIVTCFDVEMGMPNDDQQYQEFGTDQVVGTEFKMITGFSASLLSRAFVRKCNLVVYKLYQNAVISSNFEIVLQKAKERFDMPLNMDQKTIEKVLLKPTTISSMFL